MDIEFCRSVGDGTFGVSVRFPQIFRGPLGTRFNIVMTVDTLNNRRVSAPVKPIFNKLLGGPLNYGRRRSFGSR
jgi:hypothetical protein